MAQPGDPAKPGQAGTVGPTGHAAAPGLSGKPDASRDPGAPAAIGWLQRTPAWLRYAAVGAGATAAHYLLLVVLVEAARWAPPWAAGAGAALGAQVGFVGNRVFTFAHQGPWLPAWWRFQLTALLGGLVSMAVVAGGTRIGLHYLLAQGAATLLAMVLTYLVNKRWAFAA